MRRCSSCVMDESDPNIIFFDDGTCNHCRHAKIYSEKKGRVTIDKVAKWIKYNSSKYSDNQYDCIVGISGGVDSSWLVHLLAKAGLNIYILHVDTGWNTQKAVSNVYRICNKLSVKLHTKVIDWNIMRNLQLSYFYMGVINQDMPQDIGIFSAQIEACKNEKIRYLASGANNTTESVLPSAWGHHWHDLNNIKSIYKTFWNKELENFPYCNFKDLAAYRLSHSNILDLSTINILDHIDFSKQKAIEKLQEEYNYEVYSHKHGESAWTLYYQSIYLPQVYKIDKRKAHLTNLIINNDISRNEAIEKLAEPLLDNDTKKELAHLISIKLNIPYEHALKPEQFVLRGMHEDFGFSKSIINYYTERYWKADIDSRTGIFEEYINAYAENTNANKI